MAPFDRPRAKWFPSERGGRFPSLLSISSPEKAANTCPSVKTGVPFAFCEEPTEGFPFFSLSSPTGFFWKVENLHLPCSSLPYMTPINDSDFNPSRRLRACPLSTRHRILPSLSIWQPVANPFRQTFFFPFSIPFWI